MSDSIGKITISYNRSTRNWEATNGSQLAQFGSGGMGKKKALTFAIKYQHPQLAEAIERMETKYPALGDRAWNAAQLLINGHVSPAEIWESGIYGHVRSQTQPLSYSLMKASDTQIQCNCADWLNGRAPLGPGNHRLCKHVLAYRLGVYLNWFNPPRRSANGTHRGRIVSSVNNSGKEKTAVTNQAFYGNAKPVENDMQHINALYLERIGRSAHSKEKLMSWYYGS